MSDARRLILANSGMPSGGGGVTLEKGSYYPDLVEYLENKYGFGFGAIKKPVAIEENIILGDSFKEDVGVGRAKFLHITINRSSIGILLYLENYEDTYYCANLNNDTTSTYFGLAGAYMWD